MTINEFAAEVHKNAVENVLEVKHEYNKSRPYRHGGKKC
jgi:hypothetical protein